MSRHSLLYGISVRIGLLCTVTIFYDGFNEEAIRQAIRLTAATSYFLLICAFIARPLYQLTGSPGAKLLLRQRRQIGISVAVSHSYHLLMIILLNWLLSGGDVSLGRSLADLGPGVAVYGVLYAMALTSNNYSQRLLGKNWKRLHTIGIYSLMLAFAGAYTGKAMESGGYYWGICALGLAAFLLRFAAWQRRSTISDHPHLHSAE